MIDERLTDVLHMLSHIYIQWYTYMYIDLGTYKVMFQFTEDNVGRKIIEKWWIEMKTIDTEIDL